MTFIHKSYECSIDEFVLVPTSYEELDYDEDIKMILTHNENNDNNTFVTCGSQRKCFEGQVDDKANVTPSEDVTCYQKIASCL